MNILQNPLTLSLIQTATGLTTLAATLILGIMSLPKKSKQPKTPTTSKPRIPRTRTARGCFMSLLTIFITFFGILYSAIQILFATQANPFLTPWIAVPLYTFLAILCITVMLFALVRLIRGEEPPLTPMQEQDDAPVQGGEEEN